MTSCVNLKFPVAKIKESEGLAVSLSVPKDQLFPSPIPGAEPEGAFAVSLEFSVGGSRILLESRIAGSWRLPCSRCLEEHSVRFDASGEETYPAASDSIDVAEDLRQLALLEIPQRSLCRPDCKIPYGRAGKDPGSAADAPGPSPFEALKKLKKGK